MKLSESEFNRVVATWFDPSLTAREIGKRAGLSQWKVYEVWKDARRRGLLPATRRLCDAVKYGGGNNKAQGRAGFLPADAEGIGDHRPVTVGDVDLLLVALRREHGGDSARERDDMTERLSTIARSMSRGRRAGEYAA